MYKVTHFEEKLCHLLSTDNNKLCQNDSDDYTIWQFNPVERWKSVWSYLVYCDVCQAKWFPFIYWTVLLMSTFGVIYSVLEFNKNLSNAASIVALWRRRKYHVMTTALLRKCRVLGSLIMLNSWILLWYAVVNVAPKYMVPWITINAFVLTFEMLSFALEVTMGTSKFQIDTFLTLLLPWCFLLFVTCVQRVFEKAVESNDVDEMRLLKINIF